MNTIALFMMITVQVTVTAITIYFFVKVMKAPTEKGEHTELPDPLDENP
ncbi:MAG: hypothetical protein IBJ09_00315 [Bacteroidia bacterium]|nr:hypothetical protein [Bacteroidia bacterium]